MSISSKELRSEITPAGQLRLSLAELEVTPPGPDDVVVRVEAAPINPADMAELLGPADVATLMSEATADRPVTTVEVPPRLPSDVPPPLVKGRGPCNSSTPTSRHADHHPGSANEAC